VLNGEKMKIIMLKGKNSCGKTKTLCILYKKIVPENGKSNCKKQLGGNKCDFSDIVEYNNKTIAFFTMGDYSIQLCNAMNYYNTLKVDFLICACNSKLVKPFQNINNYKHEIINKTVATKKTEEHDLNQKDADEIFLKI